MKFVDICTALYDYNSQHEEELTFKAEDTLYILENDDSDWYKAQLKPKSAEEEGPIGLVPANYVERAEPIGSVTAIYTYSALAEEELSFTEDDAMVLYEKDDPDWFLAEKNGVFGLVPSNYVEESTSDMTASMTTTPPAAVHAEEEQHHEAPEKTRSIHKNNDEALSWSVHEYDVIKKKKTKAKGNLLVGNGMLCYGSETDKATPVRQFNTSQVSHIVCDGKHVHIELAGNNNLDFYTASKSEAKSIMTKVESSKLTTASPSSTSLATPSLASDQQSDISASFHSPAASFQSLPPQQHPEHPRAHSPLPPAPVEPEPQPQPQAPLCEAKWAIALYSFTPEGGEETSLAQHEQVLVTDYVGSNDWWVIEHKDGKSGIVPASYVQFQDEFEAQQAKEKEEEEELRKKREQQEETARRQKEERQRAEQQKLQEEQRRQEEERKRKQEQDEVLKKQMEEQERRRQQEEKEKARQIEAERRRKMQEEAKQKELEAKKMPNLAASAAATASPQLGNSSPRRSQIPAPPPPPPAVKPPVAMAPAAAAAALPPVHNDPTKPDPSKLRTWTDNTGAFKVDAQLLSCNNGKIRLHKTNGVKIEVPVQKMCAADLRYIEKEMGIKLIEDKSDDIPLAHLTQGFTWYNYFKKLNLPLEACTRYAKAFENEGLGESDVERLTHRRMKMLGMSEKHVQRVQRFIETNVPEPPSDDERPRGGISTGKKKVKKSVTFGATSVIQDNFVGYDDDYNPAEIQRQIQSDEEYARQLQQQEEASGYSSQHHANGGLHRRGTGRPTPTHTAPRDVNTSAFSQFNISSEPLKPTPAPVSSQPPLAAAQPPVAAATITAPSMTPQSSSVPNSGFEDDAWAPRAANLSSATSAPISHINPVQMNNNSNSPLAQPPTQPLGQSLTLEQVNSSRPVPQIPGRQRPTPQSSQQNLVDPELLAKWKGSPSLAAANTRPVPPPPAQHMSSVASFSNQVSSSPNHANATTFAQQSQQQGGSGFFSSPANMSPATNTMQNRNIAPPPPPPPQTMGAANVSLQPALQPALVPNSASPLNQPTGLHSQIQQQPAAFGNQINNNSGFGTPTMFSNAQVQQPTGFNPQYQQPTGFGAAGAQVQQPTGFGLQPQMTGYTPQAHQVTGMNNVPVSTQATGVPAAAFGPQSTGSSMNSTWSNATPDNPFGISAPNMMQNSMNYHQNIPTGANPNDKYSVFKTVDANAPSVFNSNPQNNGAFQQGNYTNQQGRW